MREPVMRDSDRRGTRRIIGVGAVLIAALVAALGLYRYGTDFTVGRSNQQPTVSTPPSASARPGSSDASKLSFLDQPRRIPDIRFADGEGHALSLSDFRGRPIVLNIWATWCVPCRKEMPTLDRLQQALDKSALLVLPLSIDRQGAAAVRRFYRQLGLKALGVYVDPSGEAANQIDAPGIPITLLLDRGGHEVGRKIGPADWASPQMIGILRRHLGL